MTSVILSVSTCKIRIKKLTYSNKKCVNLLPTTLDCYIKHMDHFIVSGVENYHWTPQYYTYRPNG